MTGRKLPSPGPHPQLRQGEVFVGYGPAVYFSMYMGLYTTLRVGDPEPGAEGQVPIFISRTEAQEKGMSIDRHGNAVPKPKAS